MRFSKNTHKHKETETQPLTFLFHHYKFIQSAYQLSCRGEKKTQLRKYTFNFILNVRRLRRQHLSQICASIYIQVSFHPLIGANFGMPKNFLEKGGNRNKVKYPNPDWFCVISLAMLHFLSRGPISYLQPWNLPVCPVELNPINSHFDLKWYSTLPTSFVFLF